MKIYDAKMSRKGYDNGVDDYILRILDIHDHRSASLIKHEFVGTDGANVINLGNRPHTVRFRAFFYGPTKFIPSTTSGTDSSYANHYTFIDDMTDSSVFHVLIHPIYGRIEGYVESLQITHDDTQQYATIDIDFVEKDIQIKGIQTAQLDLAKGAFLDKLSSLNSALKNSQLDKMNAAFNSSGFGVLVNQVIDTTKNVQSQIKGVSTVVNQFLGQVDQLTNKVDAFLGDVAAPFDQLNSAVNYSTTISSKIIQSFNNCANRILASVKSIESAPSTAFNSVIAQCNNLSNIVSSIFKLDTTFFVPPLKAAIAGNVFLYGGKILTLDQSNRTITLNMEKQQAFNSAGVRVNKIGVPPDVMSRSQLENLLFIARSVAQDALNLDRNQLEIKQMVNIATQFVDQIKITSQTVKTVSVNNIPLHLLMLQLGLDYHAAERVIKLNPSIQNPTFTEGTIQVYVK